MGENLIIEFMSKESEYGDDDNARLRDCRKLLGLGLFNLEPKYSVLVDGLKDKWRYVPSKLNGNSVLARVDAGCKSGKPLALRYSGDKPRPAKENVTF